MELHRELVAQYNIPIDRNHIIGHYRLDSVNRRNDPGPGFPWDRLFADLTRPAGRSNLLDISIEVENKKIKGFLQEDTTYAPVREIASALGWKVEWLNQSQRVLLLPPAEKNESQKNGVSVVIASQILDAIIEGDQAFAPVRKLAESMGYQVEWDNNTRTTKIRKA